MHVLKIVSTLHVQKKGLNLKPSFRRVTCSIELHSGLKNSFLTRPHAWSADQGRIMLDPVLSRIGSSVVLW
jgi:hypothetical protein